MRFKPEELRDLVAQRGLWYFWKNFPLSVLVRHFLLFRAGKR